MSEEKDRIIKNALRYAVSLLGMGYSQKHRYRIYTNGSADCSSFVFAVFLLAGVVLKTGKHDNLISCKQVYSDGFELMYPYNYDLIGKDFADIGFYKEFNWAEGDIIFYCNNVKTRRKNKITHVAICCNGNNIIHCGNNDEKTCIKEISYGDGNIVAVIRLKDNYKFGNHLSYRNKLMFKQLKINITNPEAKINCNGFWSFKYLFRLLNTRKYNCDIRL